MNEQIIASCAEALVQARRTGRLIESLSPPPSTVAEAHAIQDRVAAMFGEPVGAFKASAPPNEEPSRGLIYANTIRQSPARFTAAEAPHFGVEGEVAFRFTRDFPPSATAYSRDVVAAGVVALPAIEVVASRFQQPRSRPKLEQLADCTINAGLVCGPELKDWAHLDMTRLGVTLLVNDEPVVRRNGGHPTGDPLAAAVALVDMMRQGSGVKAGQIITAGSWTGLMFLKAGDRCTVRFDTLGEAEVTFDS